MSEYPSNWFAYRLPGQALPVFGGSDEIIEGLGVRGFVIAPFDCKEKLTLTIPLDSGQIDWRLHELPTLQSKSSTYEEYERSHKRIIGNINENKLEKCVHSRVQVIKSNIDIEKTFRRLCQVYPQAFVFAFSTPESGTWIGASPELLLKSDKHSLKTMALAGTRKAGITGPWHSKDIAEHEYVADFICKVFFDMGMPYERNLRQSINAGPVDHLCTRISSDSGIGDKALDLASRLSPTPALCGTPREAAMNLIADIEQFEREYYGGFCGPVIDTDQFDLFVTLRCACIGKSHCVLYAGGGIVSGSVCENEWQETEMKLLAIKENLVTNLK